MIDKSLEELMKSFFRGMEELRASQAKTDAQIAKTDEEIRELRASQLKTDAQIARASEDIRASQAKTEEEIRELRASQAKTDAQIAKTDEKLKEASKLLGNIGNNPGAVAEEFFYNSLKDSQELAGVKYDL